MFSVLVMVRGEERLRGRGACLRGHCEVGGVGEGIVEVGKWIGKGDS